jgi:NAD(P)H-flavin reductase
MGRVTELMAGSKLFEDLLVPALDPANDRVMICGSPGMLRDIKQLLEARGYDAFVALDEAARRRCTRLRCMAVVGAAALMWRFPI